jgi:GC-rich sequence DNA-binding factor-like protein
VLLLARVYVVPVRKQVAATVFADVSEDYSTVEAVARRLEDWQTSYPAAYRDAYMPLSAPAIFAPFVRLDLLHWDLLFGRPTAGGSTGCGEDGVRKHAARARAQCWLGP